MFCIMRSLLSSLYYRNASYSDKTAVVWQIFQKGVTLTCITFGRTSFDSTAAAKVQKVYKNGGIPGLIHLFGNSKNLLTNLVG